MGLRLAPVSFEANTNTTLNLVQKIYAGDMIALHGCTMLYVTKYVTVLNTSKKAARI